jgi:phenylacetate-CoA ligase
MLDVAAQTLGLDEIGAHVHSTDDRRDETGEHQRRVLRRWRRDRERLHARTTWDPEQVAAWQLDRIRMLVETAFATSPFYHRLYADAGYESGALVDWSDYAALPAISKQDIVDDFEAFAWRKPLGAEDVYRSRTSGSTGQALTILQDQAASDAGHVFYLRHYEQLLGRPRREEEWVYEIYLAPNRYSSLDGRFPAFTLSQTCPPALAARHIARVGAPLLWAFPSYLLRMSAEAEDLASVGLEAICTHSESSTREERRQVAARFGAPVLDEYSSEELYLIATECRHGRYHVVEDNVRVDVLGGGKHGEIVGTSLINTYMPFIRYRQGDAIELAGDAAGTCACGSRFTALTSFHGRADQLLRRRDGSVVPPDQVMGLYDRTLLTRDARVEEFRIVQDEQAAIDVLVRPPAGDDHPSPAPLSEFLAGLEELIGDRGCPIAAHVVDAMPSVLSHKRRLITSRYEPSRQESR